MGDLDLAIFGSCNIWILQYLDCAKFGSCNIWMVNFLDCARFRLFKIWIIGLWKIWSKIWKMCRIWSSCKIWKLFILIFGSQCSVSAAELKLSCARVLLVNHKIEQYKQQLFFLFVNKTTWGKICRKSYPQATEAGSSA